MLTKSVRLTEGVSEATAMRSARMLDTMIKYVSKPFMDDVEKRKKLEKQMSEYIINIRRFFEKR